jgi:hypothetical protein
MDHRGGRPGPLWEGGNVVPEGGVVDLVDKKAEEGGGLVTRVRSQLGVDVDNKGRSYGGEKTSLAL